MDRRCRHEMQKTGSRFLARLLLEVMDLVKNISITHMMENCMIISVFNGCGKMDITIILY